MLAEDCCRQARGLLADGAKYSVLRPMHRTAQRGCILEAIGALDSRRCISKRLRVVVLFRVQTSWWSHLSEGRKVH